MSKFERKSSEELLELLSDSENEISNTEEQELKEILKARGVQFEEFDPERDSNYLGSPAVKVAAVVVFFIIFRILRMVVNS